MKRTIYLILCALLAGAMVSGVAFSADKGTAMQEQEIMITGTINNANQLVDSNGQIFQVADTENGKDLVTFVGLKVQVIGTVMEKEGKKLISVSDYEIVKK